MRTPIVYPSVIVSTLLLYVDAFPAYLNEILPNVIEGRTTESSLAKRVVTFDAATQYVSTSGAYAFVAPGPTDQRGPCPGLNAMANQ